MNQAFKEMKTMIRMLRDYFSGEYKRMPVRTMLGGFLALAYVVMPVDMIPDVIPFLGQVDDVGVLGMFYYLMRKDLRHYEDWQVSAPVDAEVIDIEDVD